MKKLLLPALAITILLSSCSSSSSFESDVRKLAKMGCDMRKLEERIQKGDSAAEKELQKLQQAGDALVAELEQKHKGMKEDKEMNAKAEKIMSEMMEKCK